MATKGHEYAFRPIQRNVGYLQAKENVAEPRLDGRDAPITAIVRSARTGPFATTPATGLCAAASDGEATYPPASGQNHVRNQLLAVGFRTEEQRQQEAD